MKRNNVRRRKYVAAIAIAFTAIFALAIILITKIDTADRPEDFNAKEYAQKADWLNLMTQDGYAGKRLQADVRKKADNIYYPVAEAIQEYADSKLLSRNDYSDLVKMMMAAYLEASMSESFVKKYSSSSPQSVSALVKKVSGQQFRSIVLPAWIEYLKEYKNRDGVVFNSEKNADLIVR